MRIMLLVLCLVIAGCGGSDPPPALPRPASEPPMVAPTPPPVQVRRFDPSDLDQLADLYRRAREGDNSVWADHGLVNPRGLPDSREVGRYYQAIQVISSDPERWQAFLERVEKGKEK